VGINLCRLTQVNVTSFIVWFHHPPLLLYVEYTLKGCM